MRATILGCGEAFDERLPNTSVLVETDGMTVLCDCGYSVPPRVFSHVAGPNAIDVVYVSHPHADHYFGLPAVFGRGWEDGREKPLTVITQQAVIDQLKALMELGYRGLAARFKYPVEWRAAESGGAVEACGLEFRFAETIHSVSNLAVRFESGEKAFCYSGDGMFTDRSKALFRGADLVVHEAYYFEQSPVHADIPRLLDMAAEVGVSRLALVHVQRALRREPARIIEAMHVSRVGASLPEPGERFDI
jgi:ribonuclease BN (tRNA processing enzyme)